MEPHVVHRAGPKRPRRLTDVVRPCAHEHEECILVTSRLVSASSWIVTSASGLSSSTGRGKKKTHKKNKTQSSPSKPVPRLQEAAAGM